MTTPLTRAELRAMREASAPSRSALFSGLFWADLAERVVSSAAGGALAVITASSFALGSVESWGAVGVGAGTAALVSLLKGIVAARSGSASLVPSV
ncbi:holin [Microbacterium phage Barnstormer]|uniref:Holin n=1 Tax=Microbacterium phage Barnstormer TaxID=3028491 RepID=A0AAE9ZM30_9CAUD|nr:holin [Microbacterium phage Barnstormer]WDS52128.1 holin [Microbacterium phage UtzChips]